MIGTIIAWITGATSSPATNPELPGTGDEPRRDDPDTLGGVASRIGLFAWLIIAAVLAVAVAVSPLPPDAAAVMVHAPAVPGAVNTPELEMLPQDADQVTGWLAVNFCVFRAWRCTVLGVMTTDPGVMVTVVLAVCPLPSVAVASTLQEPAAAGAVNVPSVAIEPHCGIAE